MVVDILATAATMNRRNLSATACAMLSLVRRNLEVNASLATFIFEILSSEAASSGLSALGMLLTDTFETMVQLYLTVMRPIVTTIGALFVSLLRILGSVAEKIAHIFGIASKTVIAFSSRHIDSYISMSTFLLACSASILQRISADIVQLTSVLIYKLPADIRTAVQSLTFISTLCLEIAWPLSLLLLFSWLSGPFDATGKIRADHFADVLARKCTINRDHDMALLRGLGYLIATCTISWKLVRSSNEYSTCAVVLSSSWTMRLAIKRGALRSLDVPGVIAAVNTTIQKAKKFFGGSFSGNSQQETYVQELNDELAKTKHSEKVLQELNRDLLKRHTTMDHTVQDLQAQLQKFKRKKDASHQIQARADTLASQVKVLEKDLNTYRQQSAFLLKAKNEAQFEMELSKCTSPAAPQYKPPVATDFAVPFVLVLIDGDAYGWSDLHFAQTRYSPGASAAQAIKFEVQAYLLDHKDQIPVQSRIVVRVFQNVQARHPTRKVHYSDFQIRYPVDFPRDFTQTMPLFDYIDSGDGKERVDSKIQESTHLFISNPSCYKIFLAATTDNGFARMLEQYAYDNATRAKFVLIHPGYVIREIDALGFEAVEWPSVFQKRVMPGMSRTKAAQMARTAAKDKLEREIASVKMMIEISPTLDVFQQLSRGGVSGLFRRSGKEATVMEPSPVERIDDQSTIVDDEETVELNRVAHLETAETLKQQIKEV